MTSIEKVNAQIISKIMAAFPAIPCTAHEKIEEIARPAFKVILDEIKSERYTGYIQRTYPVRVVYFAVSKERPKSECLNIYEQLEPVIYEMTNKTESGINSQEAVLVIEFDVTDTVTLTEPSGDTGEDIENLELMEEIN